VSRNGSEVAADAYPFKPLDLERLRYEPLEKRPSKVALGDLGHPAPADVRFSTWLDSLPGVLGAAGLKELAERIARAKSARHPVVAAIGGHVVKTGCAPYLIDWIKTGILHGLAVNGATAIHDLELAIAGKTSEEVGPRLRAGSFGFARETSELFVAACARAAARGIGLGRALGELIIEHGGPGLETSLMVAARRAEIPATVHVAIGTDIVHMTAALDGAALGAASLCDFRTLCAVVATMNDGVWLNLGSAVVLPEVLLKAVAIARNLGHPLDRLVTANLDFDQKYRGLLNVLERPTSAGIALVGHHEIMIPLLHAAVATRLASTASRPERAQGQRDAFRRDHAQP
jgi:hypothetical protein